MVHRGNIQDAPSAALICQPKVEFPQMTNRILLVLPPGPLIDYAEAALEAIISPLKKAIICQGGLEATRKVHARDLGELETTNEGLQGDAILEDYGNPLVGEVGTATELARGLQLDRIGLVLGRWLLTRPVIHPPVLPLLSAVHSRPMAYCSARLRLFAVGLIGRKDETLR